MKLARLVGAGVLATVTGLTWAQAPAPVPSEEPSQPRSQPQAQPGSIPAALPTPDGAQTSTTWMKYEPATSHAIF